MGEPVQSQEVQNTTQMALFSYKAGRITLYDQDGYTKGQRALVAKS